MKSMTGFGSSEKVFNGERLSMELKSLNHRYFEFKMRSPREYARFETRMMEEMKGVVFRGHLELGIDRELGVGGEGGRYEFNEKLAQFYHKSLKQAQRRLRLEGGVGVNHILSLPDIWVSRKSIPPLNVRWRYLKKLLGECLKKMDQMRIREGKVLEVSILNYFRQVEEELSKLIKHKQEVIEQLYYKLKKRVSELLGNTPLDEQRLHQEIAYWVDRSDVSEELDRLKSHLQQFRITMKAKGAVGKQLDFIVQEMNREVNTIGAKIRDVKLSTSVIQCKTLLEKIREQVQNVE